MPKIIVKRKSTFIDMTAMSDVTVLLLTFFMLTSTFIQKEPVVGDDQYGSFVIQEIGFQPGNGRHIQMVGRFVQHNQIWFLQKEFA